MRSDDAASEDDDFGGIDTGHPTQKDAQPACVLWNREGRPLLNAAGKSQRIVSPSVGLNLQDRYEVTVS